MRVLKVNEQPAERVLEVPPPQDAAGEPSDLLAVERLDARGLPDFGRERRIRALHRAVGGRARVEHLVPAPAMVVAARGGALLGVDGALRRLAADLLRRALDPFGEDVAEALAVADHLEQAVGALGIAEGQPEADLLLGEIALLHALHDPAAHPAELVDVDTGPVDARIEPGDRVLVGEADRPARARPSLVFGLVDALALVRAVADHLDMAVAHAAGAALMAAMVEALAQLGRLPVGHVDAA